MSFEIKNGQKIQISEDQAREFIRDLFNLTDRESQLCHDLGKKNYQDVHNLLLRNGDNFMLIGADYKVLSIAHVTATMSMLDMFVNTVSLLPSPAKARLKLLVFVQEQLKLASEMVDDLLKEKSA